MTRRSAKRSCKSISELKGGGLINTLINKLPIELHIPGGYQFCGPGTALRQRLERGDRGINPLDEACKEHDIAYSKSNELADRHKADKILAEKAWERFRAKDSSLGEKASALAVTGIMKGKTKLGMGAKKKSKKGGKLKSKQNKLFAAIRKRKVPKKGGFLPFLLPLIGAIASVAGGAAGIAKAVKDSKAADETLAEQKRHNQAMEAKGKGLYLKPHNKGRGLYLKPYSKNSR